MLDKYRDYFDIDPEYFPQVNEAIINTQPDHWKKFYPHETFVKLLKDTKSIISRKQKVSLWVEGAYGTGKSHAVLTLKKLLEASETDTKEYFDRYSEQLSTDLYNNIQQIKCSGQQILTVHRYGSSSIHGDGDLVFALQESISNELKKARLEVGHSALKESTIKWLSQGWAKTAFNDLITSQYADLFSGDNVDNVIGNLSTFSGEALQDLMSKIMLVANEQRFSALTMDVDGLVEWIKEVIKENNLKAIVFIWDEFTEYFRNNMRALTGFQKIVDLSGSDPFYLFIVTHNVTHIFPENDNDWKKIMGRFLQPICNIELPENMAFRLMGEAMEENKDSQIQEDWNETRSILYERTHDSRQLVKQKANISDAELKKILPIHPYAALLLKHISSAFDSNQRSMFDFIKNDRGDEIKGFQWFIDNCGPFDENPLLTIDVLWDFFYEKGKEFLSRDIRAILDCYSFANNKNLNSDEKRVLKTLLLLQAISQRTGDSVELFIPNERNLNNAFEGSDLENDEASRIANRLIPDVLFKKPMPGGKTQYSALINATNAVELDKHKEEQRRKATSQLIHEADMESAISLGGALRLRYELHFASVSDFKATINSLRAKEASFGNIIVAVMTFAKDDAESVAIGRAIKEAIIDGSYKMIFIDASTNPLGKDLQDQYVEAMANHVLNIKQDRGLAAQYENNAKEILKKWKNKITDGEFIIYTPDKPDGERSSTIDLLYSYLERFNRQKYSEGLETGQAVNATMWTANSLASGVECGANEKVSGQFRSSNPQTKLEGYIGKDAWEVPEYWITKPYLSISKLKIAVDKIIADAFDTNGQISIATIYDFLKDPNGVYGIMPCNLTAFVLGFILKEYTDGSYNWNDGLHNEPLTVAKLKEMVAEIIKHQNTPIPRYKDKFIGMMKPEEKAFNEASSEIFRIPLNMCSSAESTRDRIRQKMKEYSFPTWAIKYLIDDFNLKSSKEDICDVIDGFGGIANNFNFGNDKSYKDIAMHIGEICIGNKEIVTDMKELVNKENCIKGMQSYLGLYQDGLLISLANEIDDGGQFINYLKKKFYVDAANWVWNVDTANKKIDELILEYKIIIESNKILPKNISFESTVREWCDRCGLIRISYLYALNYWDDLSDMMELLYHMKKSGQLLDSQREKFLDQIVMNGNAFNIFYNNQTELFKKSCSFVLGKFSDEEVREIFKLLTGDMFTAEKAIYQSSVQNAVDKYVSEQGAEKLKVFWKEKTCTESPREWSKKYLTPILCMIDDNKVPKARAAFGTLNQKQPDKNSIEKAMQYLENATFFDKLSNKGERDKAFVTVVVKSFSVMLDDLDEVREHLNNVIAVEPYDWFALPEVEKKLREMAEFKYNQTGCDKALSRIDDMDVADVKQYLKRLIRDNMVVGMEIIKGK